MNKKRKTIPPAFFYQYKPFRLQFDNGFGAISDAFYEAALRLEKSSKQDRFINSAMPLCFLYRHSIELFLKSCIIILHRGLQIAFEKDTRSELAINIGQKIIPIEQIHSIKTLHIYFNEFLSKHHKDLELASITHWSTIPSKLAELVEKIEVFDMKSTTFRYPGPNDDLKSDFRNSSINEVWGSMAPGSEYGRAFLELDASGEIATAYIWDSSRLFPFIEFLRKTSEILSTLHFALRCELGNGS